MAMSIMFTVHNILAMLLLIAVVGGVALMPLRPNQIRVRIMRLGRLLRSDRS